ncbi:DUF1146 family protein [Paenibacillus sp. ACRRX]|uniref:DUF1146 family protein n=1 Tax=unclassified Paenibacillus TaxID=185978 RepID=UPI001EF4E1C6|nr:MULTISPECIES: DUF1146 family protein [unclassified Paenibacillus]MCG7408021.1 DUF1146 family protein [Paenibacillus sp. ACRRX]MDK8181596.1 DUF1146 family protein [Paenibacillus sp. UMB4589-SE434]
MNDSFNDISAAVGVSGIVQMIVTLCCIAVAWWSLQHVKLDLVIRYPKSASGKMLHLLLAIILGRAVSLFFIDYWGWTQSLKYLF